MRFIGICLFLFIAPVSLYGLGSNDSVIVKIFNDYHRDFPLEKVYVHTNKEVYSRKDTVWFSSFLLNAQDHTASNLSRVLYVELIGPDLQIIQSLNLKVDGRGHAYGEFAIGTSFQSGLYQLRGYTNYMRNYGQDYFFKKTLKIIDQDESIATSQLDSQEISIQLFPEGGEIIAGTSNIIAFKATDSSGKGVSVTGDILDSSGEKLGSIVTEHAGMGKFLFIPDLNNTYSIRVHHRGSEFSFGFPKINESGFTLNCRSSQEVISVRARAINQSFASAFVLLQCRGQLVGVIKPKANQDYIFNVLQRAQLPSGIIQLTLFDNSGIPVMERLVFNENPSDKVYMKVNSTDIINPRGKINLDYTFKDQKNQFIEGRASVSIVSSELYLDPEVSIGSYLLLTSDLNGSIDDPNYYLDPTNPSRIEHIDLLMLTHGWRRFSWDDVFKRNFPVLRHYVERDLSLKGRVTEYRDRENGIETNIYLTLMEDFTQRVDSWTNSAGYFMFDNLNIQDSVTAIVKTQSNDERKQNKDVVVRNSFVSIHSVTKPEVKFSQIDPFVNSTPREIIDRSIEIEQINASFDESFILLDELEVEGEKLNDPIKRRAIAYTRPDTRIIVDSTVKSYTNPIDYLRGKVPSITIAGDFNMQGMSNSGAKRAIYLRAQNSLTLNTQALIIYNGLPISAEFFQNIPMKDIAMIDVLTGPEAVPYGVRGAGGVIVVYPREGGEQISPTRKNEFIGYTMYKMIGYYSPREFYSPDYTTLKENKNVRPDIRNVLYWEPNLNIENGSADLTFFASDEKGEFIVRIEGLSVDGKIIEHTTSFVVD